MAEDIHKKLNLQTNINQYEEHLLIKILPLTNTASTEPPDWSWPEVVEASERVVPWMMVLAWKNPN